MIMIHPFEGAKSWLNMVVKAKAKSKRGLYNSDIKMSHRKLYGQKSENKNSFQAKKEKSTNAQTQAKTSVKYNQIDLT